MKMNGYKCDRCGNFYKKNYSKDFANRTEENIIGIAFVNCSKQLFRSELCDNCIKQIQEFMQYPDAYVMMGTNIDQEN